jgi:predicted DNA repair protein MutK
MTRASAAQFPTVHAMSIGLIALLDDVAALAKVAAASLDDVATQAVKAGTKAAGVVIDDAAVTPRYVTGFSAAREVPIVARIAVGSLKNKLLILLPVALLLSFFAPQAITPFLMIGGLYLAYEGTEKVYEIFFPHGAHAHEAGLESIAVDPKTLEEEKIASAIKTDFILSAEIMVITLGAVSVSGIAMQATILAVVGIGITIAVYGVVALIVKADDLGLSLSQSRAAPLRAIGRGLVKGMPYFLAALSALGIAAMIWVGGGIILHGLEGYGFEGLPHVIHDAAAAVEHAVPALGGFLAWLVGALAAGLFGIVVGLIAIPAVSYVLSPLWRKVKGLLRRKPATPSDGHHG